MAPFFLDKFSPKPPIEGNDDQDQNNSLSPFTALSADDHASSFSFPFLSSTPQYQGFTQMDHHFQPPPLPLLHQEHPNLLLIGGSSEQQRPPPPLIPTANNENIVDHHGEYILRGSSKWMSTSKIRIMRKMIISSGDDRMLTTKPRRNFQVLQDQHPNLGATSGGTKVDGSPPVRVCSDCNTTKTPLWRGGPRGPKSLCNACGIRQMKARRALATSTAANTNNGVAPKAKKIKRSYNVDHTLPFKKRCKITISETTKKKLRFDDVMISLSKDSDFLRVFPQDEREAAILLMGLSCGLIRG